MRARLLLLLSLGTLVPCTSATHAAAFGLPGVDGALGSIEAPGYERGVVLIQLEEATGNAVLAALDRGRGFGELPFPKHLATLNDRYRASGIERLFPAKTTGADHVATVRARFARRAARAPKGADPARHRLEHVFRLTVDPGVDLREVARRYAADPDVTFAEPDGLVELFDPLASQQWSLSMIGASAAWPYATGAGVTVAIVDSGISAHPDLVANLWTNAAEAGGLPGVDDDANGFIDDVNGWDFGDGDADVSDAYGHGTHVAGLVAATTGNGLGIESLARDARLMAVKAFPDIPFVFFVHHAANALKYAADNGADVINNSWGVTRAQGSALVELLVAYASDLGAVVVNAAGNTPTTETCTYQPTGSERGISVSAVDDTGSPSSFTSFGVKLDVSAPGGRAQHVAVSEEVLSTIPDGSILHQFIVGNFPAVALGTGSNTYIATGGTSMAAPQVAAAAALLLEADPTLTIEEIRQIIRQSAAGWIPGGASFTTLQGFGRLDAAQAMTFQAGLPHPPESNLLEPANCDVVSGVIAVDGFSQAQAPTVWDLQIAAGSNPPVSSFTSIASGTGPVNGGTLANLDTSLYPDGSYVLRLVTLDAATAIESEDRNRFDIRQARILEPADGETLTGSSYDVVGIGGPTTGTWQLDWSPGTVGAGPWTTIAGPTPGSGPAPMTLASWPLGGLADGCYTLRLRVVVSGNTSTHQVVACVDGGLLAGFPVAVDHFPTLKSPKIADLEGDGVAELVYGAAAFQPDGTPKPGWVRKPGDGRTTPAIADVDGDGDLEVIAAVWDLNPATPNAGAPVVQAFGPAGNVEWSFAPQNPWTTGNAQGTPSSITIGDVDGDQADEVVFTVYFWYSNLLHETTLFVLDAATGVLETTISPVQLPGVSYSSPALADLDGDGRDDVVTVGFTFWFTGWLQLNAEVQVTTFNPGSPLNIQWPQAINLTTSLDGAPDPVIADVDRDGDLEILAGHHLFHHDGTPMAGWPGATLAAHATGMLAPGQDADCELEVVTSPGSFPQPTTNTDAARIFQHDGTPIVTVPMTFGETTYLQLGLENTNPGSPIYADVSGDGRADLVRPGPKGVAYDRTPIYAFGATAIPGFPKMVYAGGDSVLHATPAVGDLDGDGLSDLVIAADGYLLAWNLGFPHRPAVNPWPMFQGDLENTGAVDTLELAELTGGFRHSLAAGRFGDLSTAGENGAGQLGDGTTTPANLPVLPAACNVIQTSAGRGHSLAVVNDGTVLSWGDDSDGQLGDGTAGGPTLVPTAVTGPTGIVEVAAGLSHSIALAADGSIWTWGSNMQGQLGQGSTGGILPSPTLIPSSPGSQVTRLAAGNAFSLGLRLGNVWAFGDNSSGQLGNGTTTPSASAVQVSVLTTARAIAAGGAHALASTDAGLVYAWGANGSGQLGVVGPNATTPQALPFFGYVTEVAAGDAHSVALTADGRVFTWGANARGQLGDGTTVSHATPAQVTGIGRARRIAAGGEHTLVVLDDGSSLAFGRNQEGQLADGTNTDRPSPTPSAF